MKISRLEKHIFLIGFMGVGKTSTSRFLSRKLGVKEVDTDAMIVEQEKKAFLIFLLTKGKNISEKKRQS